MAAPFIRTVQDHPIFAAFHTMQKRLRLSMTATSKPNLVGDLPKSHRSSLGHEELPRAGCANKALSLSSLCAQKIPPRDRTWYQDPHAHPNLVSISTARILRQKACRIRLRTSLQDLLLRYWDWNDNLHLPTFGSVMCWLHLLFAPGSGLLVRAERRRQVQ
jgi:hypothetical protein